MSEPLLITDERTFSIWTIQLAKWRNAKRQGIFLLDTTAKSGIQQFAPTMENVLAFKRNQLSVREYTERYTQRMAVSRERFPKVWEGLMSSNRFAIACYCRAGEFCHRHLFATEAETYLKNKGYKVERKGELV